MGQSWYNSRRGIYTRIARDEGLGVGSGRQQSFLRSSSFASIHFARFFPPPLPPSPSSPVIATKLYPFKRQRLPATQYNFRTTKSSLRIPFTGSPRRSLLSHPLLTKLTDENMDFVILTRPCERDHEWHEHGHGSISKPILGTRGSRA